MRKASTETGYGEQEMLWDVIPETKGMKDYLVSTALRNQMQLAAISVRGVVGMRTLAFDFAVYLPVPGHARTGS